MVLHYNYLNIYILIYLFQFYNLNLFWHKEIFIVYKDENWKLLIISDFKN